MRCDKCGEDKPDTMPRLFHGTILISEGFYRERPGPKGDGDVVKVSIDPALCTACCSRMPDRQWMTVPASE